jgi:hypothetical protein
MLPGATELLAVKDELRSVEVKAELADINATSDGEFTRVGTFGVRVTSESKGKIRSSPKGRSGRFRP